jgi:hypothetical protein
MQVVQLLCLCFTEWCVSELNTGGVVTLSDIVVTRVVHPQVEQCVGAVETLARCFKDVAPVFRGGSER